MWEESNGHLKVMGYLIGQGLEYIEDQLHSIAYSWEEIQSCSIARNNLLWLDQEMKQNLESWLMVEGPIKEVKLLRIQ